MPGDRLAGLAALDASQAFVGGMAVVGLALALGSMSGKRRRSKKDKRWLLAGR